MSEIRNVHLLLFCLNRYTLFRANFSLLAVSLRRPMTHACIFTSSFKHMPAVYKHFKMSIASKYEGHAILV